jgi:succinate dehydrogenase / fumarate reductase flavoprotein subunit/fumarate reductase flavoprotein subunit
MARYDPVRLERATRDLVSRACYLEAREGRGSPLGGVWLDLTHLAADEIEAAFPGMVERTRAAGYDLARGRVEISPTAHFLMGGARIDARCRTTLPGLYAAGEDAAGVQGANRLGGNGVAESIVFGALAGDVIAEEVREAPWPDPDPAQAEAIVERATAPLRRDRGPDVYAALDDLRRLMWERVGVVRDAGSLASAEAGLAELEERTAAVGVERRRETNLEWQAALNLANLLAASRLITRAAAERRESRGAHYRSDFPAQDDRRWLVHVVLRADGAGPRVSTRPVALSRLRPAGALVEAEG